MNQFCKPLALGLAVAACFSSSIAVAQEAANNSSVLITATRLPTQAKDVLADNVVITAEQILKSGATSIVDLLQQQRGIEISRTGGAGSVSSVFIRGAANSQSVVFLDGVRIGSSTTGGATWSAIPLSQIERIEIVYGPLSSLYGADAMGGVIQLFSKKSGAKSHTSLAYGVGSNHLRKLEIGIFGSSASDFQYSLNSSKERTDGFSATKPDAYGSNSDNDGYTQKSFSGNLAWKLQKDLTIGVNFLQSTLDVDFDSRKNERDFGQQKLDNLATYIKGKFAPNWNTSLQATRNADRVFSNGPYGGHSDTVQRGWAWQNDVKLDQNALQFIAEKREEDVDSSTDKLSGKRDTSSFAASYVTKSDAHVASISARADRSSQYGSHKTGSFAYGYHVSDVLRVNASYGTSFRAPTFNELYYPRYGVASNKPELGKNAEAGLFYDDSIVQLSAVYYQNKITDLLVYVSPCKTPGTTKDTHPWGCAANVNKATLSGFTMGASTRINQLSLRATLDIQDPRDDTTRTRLARRAKQHASLGADYRMQDWTFGVETVLSGERFDNQTNTVRLAGYGIVNLVTTYQVSPDWKVLARWNNVMDKDYELAKNYRTPGSNFYLGLNYGFK